MSSKRRFKSREELQAWLAKRRCEKAAFSQRVREDFEATGAFLARDRSGLDHLLTYSARSPGKLQITRIENGEPIGHTEHSTLESAIEELWFDVG